MEPLEDRQMLTVPWTFWPLMLGQDKVARDYPWLNGGGNGVAVIDKGVDYWHPQLGGNEAMAIKSPRVVNVWDYADHNSDPFPKTPDISDPFTAHGTGVAGILAAIPFDFNGYHNQGILQNSLLYNFRTDPLNSQNTINRALTWVLQNHEQYHITAVNLTDFVGTDAPTPVYAATAKALWDAGIFVATPVANTWNDPLRPKAPISYPAKDPYIYGVGGVLQDDTLNPMTQRGPGLDIVGPSNNVTLIWYTPSTDTHSIRASGTGNSWAAPYVVGTAVLMQQIDPTIKPGEIMQILQKSGVPVTDPEQTGNYVRLDMYNAVQMTYKVRDDVFGQGLGNHIARRAVEVRMRRGAGTVTNNKLLVGAPDYYSFTLTSKATASVGLGYSNAGQRAGGTIYNSKGQIVGYIGRRGFTGALPAGKYYVRVESPQSIVGTYSINIRLAS